MKKKLICLAAAVVYAVIVISAAMLLSANPKLDVVANYAVTSFEALGEAAEMTTPDGGPYVVYSPGHAERFSYGENVQLIFDSVPFITAGFDPDRLDGNNITAKYDYIVLTSEGTSGVASVNGAIDTMESILRNNRQHIHYHMDHDLFELHLGGHAFRWARDWRNNTRGMTFVLNPESFIEAGLDPEMLEGWTLANVTLNHGRGDTVARLLKNYSFAIE